MLKTIGCAGLLVLTLAFAACGVVPPVSGDPDPDGGACGRLPPLDTTQRWRCAQLRLCGPFTLLPDGQPAHSIDAATLLNRVRCVLRHLRDGTPGLHEYSLQQAGVPWADITLLNVIPNGTVVATYIQQNDLLTRERSAHRVRQPAAYFDACLTLPLGQDLVRCLQGALGDPANGCPVCPTTGKAGDACSSSDECRSGLGCCLPCSWDPPPSDPTACQHQCMATVNDECPAIP
jgi:hypothetical protein